MSISDSILKSKNLFSFKLDRPEQRKDFTFDILLDIFRQFWLRFVTIGGLSALVIGTQIVFVTMMFAYFSEDKNLSGIFGITMKIAFSVSPFVFSTFVFFIAIISSLSLYLSRVLAVSVMIEYEKSCVRRVVETLKADKELFSTIDKTGFIILLSKDCRFGGRIAFELTNMIIPIGVSLLAFPILLYLNVYATLGLLVIILAVALIQKFFRHKVHSVSHDMEVDVQADKKSKSALFSNLCSSDRPDMSVSEEVPNPVFMNTYRRRLTIPHLGNLIGGLLFALALFMVILTFSYSTNNSTGTIILAYIIISYYTLSQFKNLSKNYMNIQIFYNYFQRAYLLIVGEFDLAREKLSQSSINANNSLDDQQLL